MLEENAGTLIEKGKEQGKITYEELNKKANAEARTIRKIGIGREDKIEDYEDKRILWVKACKNGTAQLE